MQRLDVGVLIVVTRDIAHITAHLVTRIVDGRGERPVSTVGYDFAPAFEGLAGQLGQYSLSPSLLIKIDRLRRLFEPDEQLTISQAEVLLKELQNDIVVELSEPRFLMISKDRQSLYQQQETAFGQKVIDRFPETTFDIGAAARCLALDEWTAAVFHLMRVLELGLRSIAAMVGIPSSANVDLQNWQNIIEQVEKKIRDIEQQQRSFEKVEALRFYSEAAAQFRYFKDAWRNHVSHARAKYDEQEAFNVWNHVRSFMQQLAEAEQQGSL